ncbi:uncharacterized protein LOC141654970 [Silene latifolia]|uniref:uncharacterized protein LOC141654970 n=1 Tax=Silene latifolia TaxID=37657 RepID=UPI003D783F79
MALRNIIINHSLLKLKTYRQFSSSRIISKNLYKSSLPVLSTPWLMLPPDVKDGPNGPTDNYMNIIDKSIVKIDRPTIAHGSVPFNTMCVGSARGWVAFDCDSDGSLFLANPYITEASSRNLEAILPPDYGIFKEGLYFTLTGDPLSNNFSLIMEDRRDYKGHGVQIGNDNGWQKQSSPVNSISRVAYNRKVNTVYELHLEKSGNDLQISWWHPLEDDKYEKESLDLSVDPKMIEKYWELFMYSSNHDAEKYLVVTEENDPRLFLVIRPLAKDDEVGVLTKNIELFEIDLEGDGKIEWVESIGDQALFLGRNSEPFFISTRNCSGLKSNCVYVADDLGFYDLETKCIKPFLSLGDLANIHPNVYWVAPPSFA